MSITQKTTHAAEVPGLIIEVLKEKPNFLAWILSYVNRVQELEDAIWDVYVGRFIDNAEGLQLDGLGEIVGVARNGRSDERYRTRLRVQIRLNYGSGRAKDVLEAFQLTLAADEFATLRMQENYPAAFVLDMRHEFSQDVVNELLDILGEAKGAAIRASLRYYLQPIDETFRFSATPAMPASTGRGFSTAFGPGGVWTLRNSNSSALNAITRSGSRIVAVGASGAYDSSDDAGLTWDFGTAVGFSSNQARAVASDGADGLVMVGDAGHAAYSTNAGFTFTHAAITVVVAFKGVAYGVGLYVAVGASGNLWSSPTGAAGTWTSHTSGFSSSQINAITFANGLFVAVGASGKISTSADGTNWNAQTSGVSDALNAVSYLNGLWVAVGDNGALVTSVNGTAWSVQTSGAGANSLKAVTYGAGLWAVGGAAGKLSTSPNGTAWTSQTSGFGATTINAMAGSATALIAAGNSGTITSSLDGVTWGVRTSGFGASNILCAMNDDADNIFVVAGAAEKISTSDSTATGGKFAGVQEAS